MKRLPNLDALRFILAALVIIYHVPRLSKNQGLAYFDAWPIFQRGQEAVYMFFVLSGFLIIKLIYRAKLKSSFSIKYFYYRRILRIFPLYYFVVIFGFLFYNVLLPFLGIPFTINYGFAEAFFLTVFFLPNVFAILYEPGGILEILWSIGIEEQFYLLIAPLLSWVKKRWILYVILALLIGYFCIYHFSRIGWFYRFHMVYYYLFAGGVLAVLEEKQRLERLKESKIFATIVLAGAVIFFLTDWLLTPIYFLNELITLILFALFIFILAYNPFQFVIKNQVLNHLGQISYGIYMFHVIALNFTVFLVMKIDFLQKLEAIYQIMFVNSLTFTTTIILAHLSYIYFESYFLKKKQKFRTHDTN